MRLSKRLKHVSVFLISGVEVFDEGETGGVRPGEEMAGSRVQMEV
jgi:hypothetical protein